MESKWVPKKIGLNEETIKNLLSFAGVNNFDEFIKIRASVYESNDPESRREREINELEKKQEKRKNYLIDRYNRYLGYCKKNDYLYVNGFNELKTILKELSNYQNVEFWIKKVRQLEISKKVEIFCSDFRSWTNISFKVESENYKMIEKNLNILFGSIQDLDKIDIVEKQVKKIITNLELLRTYKKKYRGINIHYVAPVVNEEHQKYIEKLEQVLTQSKKEALEFIQNIGGIYVSKKKRSRELTLEYLENIDRDSYRNCIRVLEIIDEYSYEPFQSEVDSYRVSELGLSLNIGRTKFVKSIVDLNVCRGIPSTMGNFLEERTIKACGDNYGIFEVDDELRHISQITDYKFTDKENSYAKYYIKKNYKFYNGYYCVCLGWNYNQEFYYKHEDGKWYELVTVCNRYYDPLVKDSL